MLSQRVYHGATLRDSGPCGNSATKDRLNAYFTDLECPLNADMYVL